MPPKRKTTNFWDVAMRAIDRGQFPLFAIWSLALLALVRVSRSFLERYLLNYAIWGWVLWLVTLGGWLVHVRWLRRKYSEEIDRLSEEKKSLQEQLAGRKLSSSKRKKKK